MYAIIKESGMYQESRYFYSY